MAKVVVSGYMIRYPLAGLMLAYFHYVLGLHRLGHHVTYLEESGWDDSCYDPETDSSGNSPVAGMSAVRRLFSKHNLTTPVYFVERATGIVHGGTMSDVRRELSEADALLNLGGVCWLDEFALCRHRILLDMDPLFSQVGEFAGRVLNDYHSHFSYGVNIGKPGCNIPGAGVRWHGTVPPVVLDLWNPMPSGLVFTTIAHWSAYGQVVHEGETYGQKDVEFRRVIDLPKLTDQPLELALSGESGQRWPEFEAAGWSIVSGGAISRDLDRYRNYICGSRGEFSVAKHAYVKTRSGWFSDRTVCYLAASRPVIVQETGASEWLPVGRGVLTFATLEEAAECIARVNADYPTHALAARQIAEEHFDYRKVLPRFLGQSSSTAPASEVNT